MSQNNPDKKIVKARGGFFYDIVTYLKLVVRLMGDSRVNPLLKLIPIGSLVYTIWPLDIPGPIDDAAVIGAGVYLFLMLCPQDVVDEHMKALTSTVTSVWRDPDSDKTDISPDDIIDAEFHDKP
ncbi:MAG: hypothetical protein MUO64_04810 [Anaerolineales bacterium]|jgi:hypothetical protein|nr:hypothetical protein [Anaerolineales bacterium]